MNWKNDTGARRRVVVTGLGITTKIGESIADYLKSLREGRSGITNWKRVDERVALKIGGDMSCFDLDNHLTGVGANYPSEMVIRAKKLLRTPPLSGRLTAAAAMQAFNDACLYGSKVEPESIGHILAGTNLNQQYVHENILTFKQDPEYIDPLYGLVSLDTDVLTVISEILNVQGPSYTVGSASASGGMAILAALDNLRANRVEAVVVSGAASIPDSTLLQSWVMMNALSTHSFNNEPWRASRPFDARREGFVPSEGAAAVVLETLKSAQSRGAHIYAEVFGAGATSNVSRQSTPNMDGQVRAMRAALGDAYLDPERVNYVNADATSSLLGDAVEVGAIKRVFGEHAYNIPVNSTKSMVGHCLSAAGIVDFATTVLQMRNNFVHPTINLEEPDPELDLDFVPNEARDYRIEYALSNSFGFGGLNASIILGRTQR